MQLHDLKPAPGSRKNRKRLGRGTGSGLGTTAGKGTKGQKARSGGGIRPGFEGGQMPLHRRLPKRGFSNERFATSYEIVNLDAIQEAFKSGETVSAETLKERGLVKGNKDGIKLLANGEVKKKLTVKVDKISAAAREKIVQAGGTVSLVSDAE